MINKYRVVTLCGSTKFKETFIKVQKELTLKGYIVISVGLFGHSGDDEVWNEGTKEMLDDMHKRKIDMADEIFVIDVNGYIGESTRSEIDYAKANHKIIRYYSHPNMIIDEYGGLHDEGLGWNPNGDFCGECSNISCKNCIDKKGATPIHAAYKLDIYKPDKMICEKNSDGTYKVILEGIVLTDAKDKIYKANVKIPKANIPFVPISCMLNENVINKENDFFSMEVLE